MSVLNIPILSGRSEHYVKLSSIDPYVAVGKEQAAMFSNCTIYDIVLERKGFDTTIDSKALMMVAEQLHDVLEANPDTICFFICSSKEDDIKIRNRIVRITPQHFRSKLFSLLFMRAIRKSNTHGFINRCFIVDTDEQHSDDGKLFIHLMFPAHLTAQAEMLRKGIESQTK